MNGINPYRHRYLYASGDFPRRVQRLVAVAVAGVVVVVVVGDLLVPYPKPPPVALDLWPAPAESDKSIRPTLR